MRRRLLYNFIKQSLLLDLCVCAAAYLLQRIGEAFAWIFITSLIVLLWLIVAGLFTLLEFFIYPEEP